MNYKKFEDYENYIIFKTGKIFSLIKNGFKNPYTSETGYLTFDLYNNGKSEKLMTHRLIGLLFIHNPENKSTVDHINRNILDNRIENLRWATRAEQNHNQNLRKDNTSGFKGVTYQEERKRWVARLTVKGKPHIKRFKSKEEAIVYRRELEIKYLGKGYIV